MALSIASLRCKFPDPGAPSPWTAPSPARPNNHCLATGGWWLLHYLPRHAPGGFLPSCWLPQGQDRPGPLLADAGSCLALAGCSQAGTAAAAAPALHLLLIFVREEARGCSSSAPFRKPGSPFGDWAHMAGPAAPLILLFRSHPIWLRPGGQRNQPPPQGSPPLPSLTVV